jgi:D-beta-D-heptose 7-phosphate kinase/D-beta-D-heptose 1-phosphate adenosyltransferase
MKTDYLQLLKKFKRHKILVIGDFILDAYFQGSCTRLAPEASVPVVDLVEKNYCLGGAANAAANLKALGAQVFFCSVVGKDNAAEQANLLLKEAGICSDFMVRAADRSTIIKTRVTSATQTLVRYDEGTETAIDAVAETQLIHNLHIAYYQCDAVLVADYDKGVLSETVITELKKLKLQQDKFIAVDSKRLEAFSGICPALIKPNYEEAIKLLSLPYSNQSRAAQLKPFGSHFFRKTNAAVIALTMDSEGVLLFDHGTFVHHLAAPKVIFPNVSGAGDTFISTFMLVLMAGSPIDIAAAAATAAAGIAMNKPDTAMCMEYELANALTAGEKCIRQMSLLKHKCELHRQAGERIVFTNGCFDILHSGHVSYLQRAKEMGDVLIVGLNNDESIKRLKGKNRPVNSLQNRVDVLAALSCVDYVVPFGSVKDDTPINLLKVAHPNTFVKGGDYKNKYLPEEKLLRRQGCEIVILPYVLNQSTTEIINRITASERLKIVSAN